jgi:ABC-type polysaccharide/polyol phosphate export permease
MYKILVLMRASWLAAASYRLSLLISIASLLVTVVPVYFIANALQPTMAESIRSEGGHYFGFLLVGMMVMSFVGPAMNSIPGAIGGGIATGTLEAQLNTRTRLPTILAGMLGYAFVWQAVRAMFLLLAGWWLGVEVVWGHLVFALGILALIILAYIPVGLVAASLVLAFRTSGPLTRGVLLASTLLGGVYFPTRVIPSWIERISDAIPLTYGLRALRRTILEGASIGEVLPDVMILSAFAAVLMLAGTGMFVLAFQYAKRSGTLAQY